MAQIIINVLNNEKDGVTLGYEVRPSDPDDVNEQEMTAALCFARMFADYLGSFSQEEIGDKVEATYKTLLSERIEAASAKEMENYKNESSGS